MGLTNRKRKAYQHSYYKSNKESLLQKLKSSSGKVKHTKKVWYEKNSRSILCVQKKKHSKITRKKEAERERYASQPEAKRAAERERYASQPEAKIAAERERYASQPEAKRTAERERYASQPESKRRAEREHYATQPEAKRTAKRERCASQPEAKKRSKRERYASNPEPKKAADKVNYAVHVQKRKSAMQIRYKKHRSLVLFRKTRQYYGSVLNKRVSTVVLRATACLKRAKALAKSRQRKSTACSYSLHEPTQCKRELYVKVMKQTILKKASLRKKLMCASRKCKKHFSASSKAKALPNAVANIAGRKTLNKALKLRKQYFGEFLACVRKVNDLEFPADDFGDCYHTASSEPYFYDQSYTCEKHDSPIVIDASGRCVIDPFPLLRHNYVKRAKVRIY